MRAPVFLLLSVAGLCFSEPQHVVYGFVKDAVTGINLSGVAYGLNYVQPGDTWDESRAQVTDSLGIYAVLLTIPENGRQDSIPVSRQPESRPRSPGRLGFRGGRLALTLEKRERIEITVHSITGAQVGSFSADLPAGSHDLPALVRNPGIHVYRIRIGDRISVHKLLDLPGGKVGRGRIAEHGSRPLARMAKPDWSGVAVYFAKRGYRSKKVSIQDTGWMDVALEPMHLPAGVKPGSWELASDQGKQLLLHVADGGKTIDSIRMNVSRCYLGESESSILIPGPLAIPVDGSVTLQGIKDKDTLAIQFSDSAAVATFTQAERCRVRFNTARFPITVDATVGIVTKSPDIPFYIPGQYLGLTAAPKDSLTGFRYWSGVPSSPKTNPLWIITSDAPMSIKASFAPNFILTIPEVTGKITREPLRLAYDPGDTVTVWAAPDSGWRLRGWSGPILSSVHSLAKVIMDTSKTIAPIFQAVHRLDVYSYRGWWECVPACEYDRVSDGNSGRQIAYSPADANATIKVVAHSDSGFKVGGWSGDTLRTAQDSAWILMDRSRSVWANPALKNLVKKFGTSLSGRWDHFAVSPDGRTVALATTDSILLWDLTLDARIGVIRNLVTEDMEFTADGTRLIACGGLQYGLVFDVATGAELFLIARKARALAISPDQASVAILGDSVWIYDLATRARTAAYPRLWATSSFFGGLAYSPDGSKLAYSVWNAGTTDSVAVMDSRTGAALRQFATVGTLPFAFSPDGNRLWTFSGRFGDSLAVHDIVTDASTRMYLKSSIREAAFSSDGNYLAVSGPILDEGLVVDLAAMQVIYRFPPASGSVDHLSFTADSRQILAGRGSGLLELWDFK